MIGMIFPCFKRRKEKEYDSSFIEEFAEQVKIDKKQHLIRKVDIDMISMELNNRWKHYLKCQMKLLVDDDVEWAQIINNWLEEQKFFTNASFFQNEMIYADFFSGRNKTINASSRRSLSRQTRSKEQTDARNRPTYKRTYNYMKDLEEFEKMDEGQDNKVRDVFFAGSVMGGSTMARKSLRNSLLPQKNLDNGLGLETGRSTGLMNRLTLNKIRIKNTVLRNVNNEKEDSQSGVKEERYLFKRVTGLLEDHLNNPTNCFKHLIELFQGYIIKKYEMFLKSTKSSSTISGQKCGDICNRLCKEINHFIQVIVKALILFYNFDISKFKIYFAHSKSARYVSCDVLNFENLMNFITVLMFPNRVYQLVFSFLEIKNSERNTKFGKSKEKSLTKITMNSLGISAQFQLLEEVGASNLTQEEIVKNNRKYSYIFEHSDDEFEIEKRASIQSQLDASEFRKITLEHCIERKSSLLANLKKINLNGDTSSEQTRKYSEAIGTINYMNLVESPFEKMKVLLLVVRRVIKAINEYHGHRKSKREVMTGEQLMGLVVYIVSRSSCPALLTHLEFIRFFLPKKLSNTFCGYYLTVFESACEYLINFDRKKKKAITEIEDEENGSKSDN